MSLADLFSGLFPGRHRGSRPEHQGETPDGSALEGAVVYECRNCGLTVDADTTACPSCDRGEIVSYPID